MDKLIKILVNLIDPAILLVIGLIFIKVALTVLKKILQRSKLDEALHKFIITTVKYVLLIILAMMVMDQMGIDTKSMVTVLGVSGGAMALALKDSLSNIAGGFIILITKPFARGDYVDINGTLGTVNQIDMLLTTLVTYDNKTITMPNGLVSTAVITNYTKAEQRRVDCLFVLSSGTDVSKAKQIMFDVANKNDKVLKNLEMTAGVACSTPHGIHIEFKVWAKTDDYWDVKYYLEENIKTAFEKEGIKLSFNKLDILVKDM